MRKSDPPVRKDGLCAQCKGPRDKPAQTIYGGAEYELDPFCSSKCCRLWHKTEDGDAGLAAMRREP